MGRGRGMWRQLHDVDTDIECVLLHARRCARRVPDTLPPLSRACRSSLSSRALPS